MPLTAAGQMQQTKHYSMIASARLISVAGMVSPKAFATRRLIATVARSSSAARWEGQRASRPLRSCPQRLLRGDNSQLLERERTRWIILPAFRPEGAPLTNFAKALAERCANSSAWREWRARLEGSSPLALLKGVGSSMSNTIRVCLPASDAGLGHSRRVSRFADWRSSVAPESRLEAGGLSGLPLSDEIVLGLQ
jgi:hypothetical protein